MIIVTLRALTTVNSFWKQIYATDNRPSRELFSTS